MWGTPHCGYNNITRRVDKHVEVYRNNHCGHSNIEVNITRTRATPYSHTTVTIHREGCSCHSCCHMGPHVHIAPVHVHVAPVQTYQTQTTTTTTTTTRTTIAPAREIYFLPPYSSSP